MLSIVARLKPGTRDNRCGMIPLDPQMSRLRVKPTCREICFAEKYHEVFMIVGKHRRKRRHHLSVFEAPHG